MMRSRITSRVVAGLVAAVVVATPAAADNTFCLGSIFMIPDGSLYLGSFTADNQERWFQFVAKGRRSYAIAVENLSPTDAFLSVIIGGLHVGSLSSPHC
jgi:hypothetical protein